jgi:hypothetical protein
VSDLTAATNNNVSAQKNAFQKFDYTLSRNAYGGTSGDWDNFTKTGLTRYERIFATFSGVKYYYDSLITYSVKQTRDGETAYTFIDGGLDGSRVQTIGSDYYRAIIVTAIVVPTVAGDWVEFPVP